MQLPITIKLAFLEYIVHTGKPDKDAREMTWFLLDRGADPGMALTEAKDFKSSRLYRVGGGLGSTRRPRDAGAVQKAEEK